MRSVTIGRSSNFTSFSVPETTGRGVPSHVRSPYGKIRILAPRSAHFFKEIIALASEVYFILGIAPWCTKNRPIIPFRKLDSVARKLTCFVAAAPSRRGSKKLQWFARKSTGSFSGILF